jgi:hypothetical protein
MNFHQQSNSSLFEQERQMQAIEILKSVMAELQDNEIYDYTPSIQAAISQLESQPQITFNYTKLRNFASAKRDKIIGWFDGPIFEDGGSLAIKETSVSLLPKIYDFFVNALIAPKVSTNLAATDLGDFAFSDEGKLLLSSRLDCEGFYQTMCYLFFLDCRKMNVERHMFHSIESIPFERDEKTQFQFDFDSCEEGTGFQFSITNNGEQSKSTCTTHQRKCLLEQYEKILDSGIIYFRDQPIEEGKEFTVSNSKFWLNRVPAHQLTHQQSMHYSRVLFQFVISFIKDELRIKPVVDL